MKHFPTFTRIARALRKPLLTTGFIVLGIGLIVLVYKLPQWQIEATQPPLTGKERIEAENNTRDILLKGIGGAFFFITAYFSWRNLQTAEKNLRISEDKQVTERFSKAVEQLGSEKIALRLGGIYSLERIAKDSPKDHWVIMEVLTAFVREASPVSTNHAEQQEQSDGKDNTSLERAEQQKLPTDIQAALTVIGRRKTERDSKGQWIDLRETHLIGADLAGTDFTRANLSEANLSRANLAEADLTTVNLFMANLTRANLIGANLIGANFTGANLFVANLAEADLAEANLFMANLKGADLTRADLTRADLTRANLTEALLSEANFTGANLSKAKFLTVDQIKKAKNWEKAIYNEPFQKELGLLPEAPKEESSEE